MTESILGFAEKFNGFYGYVILCVCAFIENIVPPIPGDTVTVIGGYLAGTGKLNMFGVVLATTIGSFSGFMAMFFLGKYFGSRFFIDRDFFFFSKKNFIKVSEWFEKYGYTVVFCNRFLSGARSVISLFAGITGMNPIKVAVYCFISCFVWNLLLVFAGYKVGENWELILDMLEKYNLIVMFILMVFIAVIVIRKMYNRNSAAKKS
jgi:membrane protein DedA with SNARE-associated domain